MDSNAFQESINKIEDSAYINMLDPNIDLSNVMNNIILAQLIAYNSMYHFSDNNNLTIRQYKITMKKRITLLKRFLDTCKNYKKIKQVEIF